MAIPCKHCCRTTGPCRGRGLLWISISQAPVFDRSQLLTQYAKERNNVTQQLQLRALIDLIYEGLEGLAEPRLFGLGRGFVSVRIGLSISPNPSRQENGKARIVSPAWSTHPANVHNVHALQGHLFPAPALRTWRPFPRRFDSWIASRPFHFHTLSHASYILRPLRIMRAGVSQFSLRKRADAQAR